MSAPVDSILVDADGPTPESDPITRSDLWDGLTVWVSQLYKTKTIHRTPDCHQLVRARTVVSDRLADCPERYVLCRSVDCWPREQQVDQSRTCPFCGQSVAKLHHHLPCEGGDR